MNTITNNKNITTNYLYLIKIWLVGFLSAESLFFSQVISSRLNTYVASNNYESISLILGGFYFVTIFVYLFFRKAHLELVKIIRSKRIDIILIFCSGFASCVYLGGIGTSQFHDIVSRLTINQILVIISFPFVLALPILIREMHLWLAKRKKKEAPFFISDNEKYTKQEDLLDLYEVAERFAERVMNQGSSDSLVFGVDAPWGVGKSTFVNFCKEYWENKHAKQVIVYVFNPLRYENRENLLEKFIDGLIRVIQKHDFIPEIKPLISRYSQLIRNVKGNILGFFDFEIGTNNYSVDDAFEDLETVLSSINKKIIVVIDDLDRLNLSAIKDLLFTVKKSFTLPNVTYVLCYDAENISSLEQEKPDLEKITEFLEKFVNVKVSLYLSSEKLSNYVSTNLEKSLSGNSQADPILVSKAIGGLKNIFNSNDYHYYVLFIGDIRKLKRLINTVLLLDLEKTDFDNSDIDNYDLIHLLLIYINYPNIFRKIYNAETGGKKGFFSAVSQYEDGYPKDDRRTTPFSESEYKNSIKYNEYIKSLSLSKNQLFLLNKIFDVSKRLEQPGRGNVPAEVRASFACFNGDPWSTGGRNLEAYLKLIVQSSKPQPTDQYKFYLNQKNKLLSKVKIEDILSEEPFSYSNSESSHKQLWKIIINSANEFDYQTGNKLIIYLVNNIINYSHFEHEKIGLGLRHDLSFYIVKLLDQAGWVDENGTHRSNFDENVTEIADWILGEGKHTKESILESLSSDKRGVLGLYDLLSFRLYCSADRGGDVFNLTRALSKHGDPNAPTEGSTKIIAIAEMREISQRVFQIFNNKYVKTKKNVFDLIDNLTLDDLIVKYKKFLKAKVKSGEIEDVEQLVAQFKSRMKAFIAYQLGSSSTSFGIACGYYDLQGKNDKNEINKHINDYLFNVCFNPGNNKATRKNYEHFLDYLLINFASVFESVKGRKYIPHIDEFTKVLNKERLLEYWKGNRIKIKSLNLQNEDKTVANGNYIASYKGDLEDVYKLLDKFVDEIKEKTVSQGEIVKTSI